MTEEISEEIDPDDIPLMISDCEKRESKLDDWEQGFIDSISKRVGDGKSLTDKQIARLDSIWERIT